MIISNDFGHDESQGRRQSRKASSHKEACGCAVCGGGMTLEKFDQWARENIEKHGFCIHHVSEPGDKYSNIHTHGFEKTWKHPDFQIVIPLSQKTAHGIFWELADQVKAGKVFHVGDQVDGVVRDYPIRFAAAVENKRDVLRIVFSDAKGRFPGDPDVNPLYDGQVTAKV
jgi:hypothetical protein